ncbi:hypothetical protein J5N97_003852 [Dioscorea zingiberensis]|uniref:Uncharacterized protein n=1 Tax=Dioscorea zingiberensis TaxID=325984 RepID=A0A9D5D5D9_9LILI|nr:hypothetical protein J5N97_003852 [Dioscorea zingiberensis]
MEYCSHTILVVSPGSTSSSNGVSFTGRLHYNSPLRSSSLSFSAQDPLTSPSPYIHLLLLILSIRLPLLIILIYDTISCSSLPLRPPTTHRDPYLLRWLPLWLPIQVPHPKHPPPHLQWHRGRPGLVPVFPTLTFPNHYSIVTGLYPESHGIINNFFIDPISGDAFSKHRHGPRWWLGEPLWETVSNQGFKAAAYFWAGSEVSKGSWDCPPEFCPKYDSSVPFEKRVDDVLSYFDLPIDEILLFIALYFEEPDSKGHEFGPDHP